MQELNLSNVGKYFKSTGAKDHPYFWIEGAGSFIPNMLECITFTDYSPTVKKYSEFENDHEDELKELFIKHGSDKFINPYYKYYSNVLSSKSDINILEIGMGTKNPNIASTMFFYKQEQGFDSTPGSSLRAFRDFVKGSKVYGADIDEEILFEEENIKTAKVDQLVKSELDDLFKGVTFDFAVIDVSHHLQAVAPFPISLTNRMTWVSKLVKGNITMLENWKVVDFILSRIEGITTEFVTDDEEKVYIYVLSK
jgi:hypothetical protein